MNLSTPRVSFLDSHPWLLRILLAVCFLGALGIRLVDLTDLPLDFQPSRQLQSMIKARGMYYQDLTNVPAWQQELAIAYWKAQPIQEPEIMEHLAAFSYLIANGEYLWIPRLYSILFWLIGGAALFSLIRALVGTDGAIVGTVFYLFSYYSSIASRSFQPDPLMVMFILLGLWGLYRWYRNPTWIWTVVAGLLCGAAIYVKAPAIFFIAGGIGGLLFGDRGFKKTIRDPKVWLLSFLALLPGLIYHILGTLILDFLGSGYYGLRIYPSLLVNPVSYIQWEAEINQVVGFPAFLVSLLGVFLLTTRKARSLLAGLWVSYFIYGAVFIYFTTSHDYYHLPMVPLVAIGIAAVTQVLIDHLGGLWKGSWIYGIAFGLVFIWAGQQAYAVRNTLRKVDYRPDAVFWEKLGNELRGHSVVGITPDYGSRIQYWGWDKIIYWPTTGDFQKSALTGGQYDLLQLFQEKTEGEELFLVTVPSELDKQEGLKELLTNNYAIYDQGDGYILYDLRVPIN
jgi:4-amino-4-deoxy-L-arabinose transferase-like glycosyltransferase